MSIATCSFRKTPKNYWRRKCIVSPNCHCVDNEKGKILASFLASESRFTHVSVGWSTSHSFRGSTQKLRQEFGTRCRQTLKLARARGRTVVTGRDRRVLGGGARVEGQIGRDLPAWPQSVVDADEVRHPRLRHLRLEHLTVGSAQGSLTVPLQSNTMKDL